MEQAETDSLVDKLLGKASNLYNQDFTIPTYGGVSTSGAKGEVAKARASRDEMDTTISTERGNVADATRRMKEGITGEGQATADKAMADQELAERKAKASRDVNQLFGLGADVSDAVAQTAVKVTGERQILDKELAEIKQMQAVGPLDDPLAWLFNGIQLPSKISQYNVSAQQINNDEESITFGIKTATDLDLQIQKGIPTITAAQAKATADKAKAEAIKLGAVADENMARTNVSFAVQKLSGDMSIANATVETTRLDMANAQQVYASKIAAINMAQTKADRLVKSAELIDKIGDSKALDLVLANSDKIRGFPEGTTTRQSIKFMKPEERANIVAIGAGSFGNNPVDNYEAARTAKFGPGVSQDLVKTFDYVQSKISASSSAADGLISAGRLTPDQKRSNVTSGVNTLIAADQIHAAKVGNIFHELEPAKMIASGKILVDSPLGKAIAPLATVDQPITSNIIAATILAQFGDDPVKSGAALANYYQENMQLRNDVMQYGVAGIKIVPGYPVQVGSMFNKVTLDLTKPGDAVKYTLFLQLNKKLADASSAAPDAWVRK